MPNGETFELEHIIARKRIDAADSSRPRHILGNSLGNCMYLPRGINNPKKDKTLYEINDHNRYSQLIKESQYFSEDEMQKAMQALTASDYESVNGLLRERSRQVAHTLVRALLKDSVSREIIYVFLTIFLYLLKCPQSLILSALRAFCFCGKPHISRSIFLYFLYQTWLKSW